MEWYDAPEAIKYARFDEEAPPTKRESSSYIISIAAREIQEAVKDLDITRQVSNISTHIMFTVIHTISIRSVKSAPQTYRVLLPAILVTVAWVRASFPVVGVVLSTSAAEVVHNVCKLIFKVNITSIVSYQNVMPKPRWLLPC